MGTTTVRGKWVLTTLFILEYFYADSTAHLQWFTPWPTFRTVKESTTFGYFTPAPATSTFLPHVNNSFAAEFWPPKITSLPKQKVETLCGDEEKRNPGVLVLECSFAGFPEPLVKWKKYEGHVPSKCQQSSVNGHGTLTCPFQQSDQGAYSCVAENSEGSAESQPKSIVRCSNKINCNGFRVKTEEDIEHCLDCFCSGKTSQCKSIASDLTVVDIPFPTALTEVFVFNDGEVVFIPSDSELVPSNEIRNSSTEISYCWLSKRELKETSFLKSYGRNLKIPRHLGKFDFMSDAPDIIIRGNGIDLMYKFNRISHSAKVFDVRFWPGNWHFLSKETAKRRDLMKVLANVDAMLFRCEYKQGVTTHFANKTLGIESSVITNFTRSESYVEKCACPKGYGGLSCETCASGYRMKTTGNDFQCEKIACPEGWSGDKCGECDASKNYFPSGGTCVKTICNPEGSVSLNPDSKGKCTCHKNVVGNSCDQCKAGLFSVRDGCLKCWCSGVSDDCQSSDWYKTVISSTSLGGYNSSEGQNFWLLPSMFAGNLLTSYGGHLNYTITYASFIPKQRKLLTIEILTADDVTLSYTHEGIDESVFSSEKSWSAKLVEREWRKSNGSAVTRGEFLEFLMKVKAVYIESPYHLSSGKANLKSARMTAAKPTGDGEEERALSVEQCKCPPGYTGLSCEKCTDNYYRSKNGSRNVCVKCDCDNCDPLLGCLDCPAGQYQVGQTEEQKPICKPCPCNQNELNCYKDSYNQVICRCRPGFMGVNCESEIQGSESFVIVSMSPRKVDSRKVGATVHFNCSYASDEDMKVVVKKFYSKREEAEVNGIEEQSTGNAHGKANLFDVVLEDDLDHVDCFVYTSKNTLVGHVRSETSPIKIMKPVKITNCYSDVISISENGSWDLICTATGTPAPVVTWFRSTSKDQKEKLPSIDGVYYIQNNETTLKNNGTVYYCLAENSEGSKDRCTIVLTIRDKCETIHIEPEKVVVKEGETVSIQCRTSEYSPITWKRIGAFPSPRQKVKNGKLEIVAAEVGDSGTYMCKAETKTGTINVTASVEVQEKKIPLAVSILENDKTLQAGENFSVACEASGKPKPTVTWTKEKENFLRNVAAEKETLKITGAEVGNTGVYKCTGRTKEEEAVAFILITVEDKRKKPQVAINASTSIRAIEGQSVIVVCTPTKGSPAPSIEWSKKSSFSWIVLGQNGTLALKNITRFQDGDYKCKGKNSVGESEAFVKIHVLIPPKVNISVEEISVHEGENVVIDCMAIGYPKPKVTWIGKPSNAEGTYDSRTSSPVLVYPLQSAKEQIKFTALKNMDELKIKCVAESEAGRDEISARLKILQPKVTDGPDSVEFVPIGSNFELTCDPFIGNATWKKEDGHLEGDVCEGANGLIIPSVQIQHGGKYVCQVKNMYSSNTKRITLNVVGFAPRFRQISRSYMILPVTLKSSYTLEAKISFRPAGENGLLLEKRQNDFNLYLHKSRLHLYVRPKKGNPVNVTSDVIFEQNKWYSVVVFITSSNLDITLYDERSSIIERITRTLTNFDLGLETEDEFSVGGAFPRNGMTPLTRRRLFLHIPSFEGCISRLTIEPKEFDLVADGVFSHNVTLCSRCSQNEDPCQGRGKCLDAPTQYGFICVCPRNKEGNTSCPASCTNKGCETQLNLCQLVNPCKRKDLHACSNRVATLECKCSNGYSGATCETVVEYSFCAKGNGFVKLPSSLLVRRSLHTPEIIKIKFVLHKVDGLLLWQGDGTNHLIIAVRNRFLEYVYLNQGFELKVRADVELPLQEKIMVEVKRVDNITQLKLDFPSGSVVTKNSTTFSTNRVKGDIYLGNLPKTIPYYNKIYAGLSGCINYVRFGDKGKINLHDYTLEKFNTLGNSWHTDQDSKSKDGEYEDYDEDEDNYSNQSDSEVYA